MHDNIIIHDYLFCEYACFMMCYVFRLLPGPLKDAVEVWSWKKCYSMQEVNSALSKVQLVGYSQKVVCLYI